MKTMKNFCYSLAILLSISLGFSIFAEEKKCDYVEIPASIGKSSKQYYVLQEIVDGLSRVMNTIRNVYNPDLKTSLERAKELVLQVKIPKDFSGKVPESQASSSRAVERFNKECKRCAGVYAEYITSVQNSLSLQKKLDYHLGANGYFNASHYLNEKDQRRFGESGFWNCEDILSKSGFFDEIAKLMGVKRYPNIKDAIHLLVQHDVL